MTLSEIVDYRNLIDTLLTNLECEAAIRHLDGVKAAVTGHTLQLGRYDKRLDEELKTVQAGVTNFRQIMIQLRDHLAQEIVDREGDLFSQSKRIYEEEMCFETPRYILDRRLAIDSESNILLRSRLRNCADWRVPGMIIRPGRETFIEDLVPLDPLYVVDQHQDLLAPSVQQFTPAYQRRLRQYVINDYTNRDNIMSQLPDRQFGLIFAYNYFNYKPIDIVHNYLVEINKKLRPGGVFLMTYNNCDRAQGVGLAERRFMAYTPRRLVLKHAWELDLELTHEHDGEGNLSWLEFTKAGTITSLRGGQALAKILR